MFACGSRGSGFGSDGGTDDASTGTGGTIGFDFDGSDDVDTSCTQCSADLHEVLTCGDNPQVVQTCTGNQGCGPNGCIDACAAAAANKSSIGCDYYAIPSDAWSTTYDSGGAAGNCFAAFVNNNWSTDMNVSLVWKGQTINGNDYAYLPKGSGASITYQKIPTTGIPPNSMAIVFLNDYKPGLGTLKCNCPASVQAAVSGEDMVIHSTTVGHAMEIKTTAGRHVGSVSIRARRSATRRGAGRQMRQRPSHHQERRAVRHHRLGLRQRVELRVPRGGERQADEHRRRPAHAEVSHFQGYLKFWTAQSWLVPFVLKPHAASVK